MKSKWRSFEDARKFAHSLKLKRSDDWKEYCKSGSRPEDIPYSPNEVYKKDWINMGDWLGTGKIGNRNREYLAFKDAKKFAHSLNLKSNKEWQIHHRNNKPNNLPIRPDHTYKNKGWISWGNFLGTGVIATTKKQYRSFEDAREFVHTLGLKGQKEWEKYYKSGNKPDDIPTHPDATYKNKGYKGYGDWVGTGRIATRDVVYCSFEDARAFVHTLNLKSGKYWRHYTQSGNKPDDVPANPNHVYKNKGWISWGNWLGTGRVADQLKIFQRFEDAREFVHTLGLEGQKEWKIYCKSGNKPVDIPANPNHVYKNKGWNGIIDWMGNYKKIKKLMLKKQYYSFDDARKFVRKLKLKTSIEFDQQKNLDSFPNSIPKSPQTFYHKKGWNGWGDFLGASTNFNKKFRPFEDARKFVHTLNLKSARKWETYCKSGNKPVDIPQNPRVTYKNKGWKNWGDWLGTFEIASYKKEFLPFNEAREEIKKLTKKYNLKNNSDWDKFVKSGNKPDNIPAAPWWVYRTKKK